MVAIDELSDGFWKVVKIFLFEFKTVEVHQWLFFLYCFLQITYRAIVKELVPENIYPTKKELRVALEEYLAKNAENYISTIG